MVIAGYIPGWRPYLLFSALLLLLLLLLLLPGVVLQQDRNPALGRRRVGSLQGGSCLPGGLGQAH